MMNSALFGVALTFVVYSISKYIDEKLNISLLNAIVISIVTIMLILYVFDIPYDVYNKGGSLISFFIAPATLGLVIPLYKRLDLLKGNVFIIVVGIIAGSLVGLLVLIILGKLLNVDDMIILSMLPKSSSTAIALEISNSIGGIVPITVAGTIVAGIGGYAICEKVLGIFKIKSDIAKGIAVGTSSHILGTLRAKELGENIGAMSSLAIVITGIILVFMIPMVLRFL